MSGQILLLSGGLDSTALAALIHPDRAIVIDYGQVCSEAEIRAARAVAGMLQIRLDVLRADCGAVGSGDLGGTSPVDVAPSREWWPYRNQLLATLAAAATLRYGMGELVFATVRTDRFHVDGSPEFFGQLDRLMRSQEGSMGVCAPAIELTSGDLIRRAGIGRSVLGWCHSCHVSDLACGVCRGCAKRAEVLSEVFGKI